jgi:glyoxylase-like metal-dependent hydrolase (beta-lactamase superfamily II)
MMAYMVSLELLLERDDRIYWPTHGPAVVEPHAHVKAFIDHRKEREEQIMACVRQGVGVIGDMVPMMYKETPEYLYPAAARSTLAAVEYLVRRGELEGSDGISLESVYTATR